MALQIGQNFISFSSKFIFAGWYDQRLRTVMIGFRIIKTVTHSLTAGCSCQLKAKVER